MTQSIKKNLAVIITAILLATTTVVSLPMLASAQTPPAPAPTVPASDLKKGVNCGSNLTLANNDTCGATPTAADDSLNTLIKNIINIFSAIVGAVCVIMIIIGGFRYVTSGGDSNNVGGAKNTILYAIVGLIIVAFAQIIVRFVLQSTNS